MYRAIAASNSMPPLWYARVATLERLDGIDRACLALARYGRQPLEWLWRLPIVELHRQHRLLGDVMRETESGLDLED